MDELSWTPGRPGKGALLNDGTVITWNYSGDIDDAQHWDVLAEMGYGYTASRFNFYIEPDGIVRSLEGEVNPEAAAELGRAGFDVKELPIDTWEGWEASIHIANVLNWDEGQYGRGIIANGTVHTFDSEEYFNHADYEFKHGLRGDARFGIQPDGQVLNADVGELPLWAIEAIEEADPRLHVTNGTEMGWQG